MTINNYKLRMRNTQLSSKCLNGGVKKAFIDIQRWSVKANDFVRILLLPLDLGHVILAHLRNMSTESTKVLFVSSCSLIGTISILVVASAEILISHVLQSTCNLVAIPNL